MKSRIRPNKYKRILFPSDLLNKNRSLLLPKLQLIQNHWMQGMQESQVVAEYLICFLELFRAKKYLGAAHIPALSPLTFEDSARAYFNNYSLRSIPLAASRALVAWAGNRIQLKLTDKIPTAYEMLQLQAEGARYITCFFDEKNIFEFPENGRDPFVFVIHDLIHADHFFGDPNLYREQQSFYQMLLARYENGEFQPFIKNEEFIGKFEYLIGDMNSHPTHLNQTLNHLLMAYT